MSTSRLQRQVSALLSVHLGQYTIRENTRPEWLEGLELDFYIEELNVGIEVQGKQHYTYTSHFHENYAAFLALRGRDERKSDLCAHLGIDLYCIESGGDALNLIEQLTQVQLTATIHPNFIALQERQEAAVSAKRIQAMLQTKGAQVLIKSIHRYRSQRDQSAGTHKENLERAVIHRTNRLRDKFKRRFTRKQIKEFMSLV